MSTTQDGISPTMNSGVAVATTFVLLAQVTRAAFGPLVARYRAKRALRALAELDAHLLADVGLERADITCPEALRAKADLRDRRGARKSIGPANQNRTVRAA